MKHKEKLKNYRRMNLKDLKKELKRVEGEYTKSYGMMGMAKLKNDEKQSSKGSDISKRIRKERAIILTIIKERDL